MVDRFLSRQGVGLALLFMVAELSYINTKSLQYMFDEKAILDMVFGIIGAIAFSIVTVLIMRLSKRKSLKVIFPVFDIALVFCGLNLSHADTLLDNPIRFAMSIFLSLFSGLITYSLGQINADQHESDSEQSKLKLLESENNSLKSNLRETEGKLEAVNSNYSKISSDYKVTCEKEKSLKSNLYNSESNLSKITTDFENLKRELQVNLSQMAELQSELQITRERAERYEKIALAAEVARLKKKAEKNLTPEEKELLNKAA
jgi:hypothetical protein